ncbi:hypothetical protein [Pollutibacter soli]|uniref:hypothetical protein n=1 Tax=Pollutibacter soli TaxID=3034157 RepID=UPI003013B34D
MRPGKLVLLIILLMQSYEGKSQVEKDNWMIGGQINGAFQKFGEETQFKNRSIEISITPKAGYFVLDKFAVGINTGYSFTHSKYFNSSISDWDENSFSRFTPGIFTRYYFLAPASKINLFGELAGGLRLAAFKSDNGDTKYNGYQYSGAFGMAYFLNKTVSLETSLMYQYQTENSHSPGVHNIILNLGFQVYLSPKKSSKKQ